VNFPFVCVVVLLPPYRVLMVQWYELNISSAHLTVLHAKGLLLGPEGYHVPDDHR
jgi:hypothetical protein